MGRGRKLNDDATILVEESKADTGESPENKAGNYIDPAGDGEIESKELGESGNPADTPPDKTERPNDVPVAAPPKMDEKKVRLVLVKAASYTVAGNSDIGKIKKNVPFETDIQTAARLLATGLFEEKG
jgi:hypothetical protein